MKILFPIIAVAIIAVLSYIVRRQTRSNQASAEYSQHLAEEAEALRRQLREVDKVIESSAGGLEKRIGEHQEIVAAITALQPTLFKDEPGLEHWLNANNQFFCALKAARQTNTSN
ncbi:hypothetical protein [Agrobacterium tumefaciens]|uniref:hypothetical protein n=1 Tax=Agrobacterium tumefaciens TaxID=358 RepID=UPI001572FCA3|nr:hypothetical protein [Agrobacterium tumefaciens]NTB05889.1 hypothetical protein [Agrobacterium tumefaciens]